MEKGVENLLREKLAEKFLNLGRGLDIQIYEAKKSLQNFNPKSTSPRHIIIKLSPIKNRISKAAREKRKKKHISKGISAKLFADFLAVLHRLVESGIRYSQCRNGKTTKNSDWIRRMELPEMFHQWKNFTKIAPEIAADPDDQNNPTA